MNNRHLPAGQAMQGGGPGSEMGPGGGSGPRGPRRQYHNQAYMPQHQHQPVHGMYGYNMGGHPGAHYPQGYYNQHLNNPYVQPGMGMQQQYMPYPHQHQQAHHHQPQPYAARSPPAHPIQQQQQHYAPIVTSGMGQPPYARQAQHSPAVPAAYQPPPPPPAAIPRHPSHTPSSTHSTQAVAPPPSVIASSGTTAVASPPQPVQPEQAVPAESQATPVSKTPKPATPVQHLTQPPPEPERVVSPKEEEPQADRTPFRPPLPWYSHPGEPFPKQAKKKRRRAPVQKHTAVELPAAPSEATGVNPASSEMDQMPTKPTSQEIVSGTPKAVETPQVSAHPDTPSTSENAPSTSPTSPSSTHASTAQTQATATPTAPAAAPKPAAPRTAIPAIPVIPALPKKDSSKPAPEKSSPPRNEQAPATDVKSPPPETTTARDEATAQKPLPVAAPKPKTWSGLFTAAAASKSSVGANGLAGSGPPSSRSQAGSDAAAQSASSGLPGKTGPGSLVEALRSYKVGGGEQITFIEPRGLINTGNMCYMNSVLQVLVFCTPFYDFLHQVHKKAAHSFKSETPLIDAMVLFMNEFKVIDSAGSVDTLRRRLKTEHLDKFGEPFTPEFVYDVIKKLPRFASMRRGHQQDAEEFLGFLLESLHDECIQVMRATPATANSPTATSSPLSTHDVSDANGWVEVGHRQKPTVTRSSGHPQIPSPITKIFGGQLRSELRVPGLKDSVTLEPYQPLQLDITAGNVRNIVDALKGLTNPESLHGDFRSPRGKGVSATKQVFIETLPPILILHLKRFQFDAEGNGTVKVWKKVGYPLELEIPKEVFPRGKRNTMTAEGVGGPRYKLSAVVYHHGKNASGGHYTVDVRRQDGTDWIRLDDTVIRRIKSEDVAEGGAEEDNKSPDRADARKDGIVGGTGNRFSGIDNEESGDEDGWKHVAHAANGKKWSSVVNGAPAATNAPAKKLAKENIKDNKVAYLLFYQRV